MTDQERDRECIGRLVAGDAEGIGALYDRHGALLFRVAFHILKDRAEVEDLLQEVWLKVWKSPESYDPGRGSVAAWLVTLTRSRALDRYRSRAVRRRREAETSEPTASLNPGSTPGDGSQEAIRKALASIEPHQRQVLELAYWHGFTQGQIAEHLSSPLGTVKSWTRQGLSRLRSQLAGEEPR